MLKIRKIYKDPAKCLRRKSEDVVFPLSKEDQETAQYLYDYLEFASKEENEIKYNLRPGVGLAAPQIGINKRILAIYIINKEDEERRVPEDLKLILINPTVISHSARLAYLKTGEGCLSVDKDYEGYIYRYAFLTVRAYNLLSNKVETIKLRGFAAIVLQHELDHLNGVLFYDHIDKYDPFKVIEGSQEI